MTSEPQLMRERPLVLVVDDDPGVLAMLGRVARRGFDVSCSAKPVVVA